MSNAMSRNPRPWFYVKTMAGRRGLIRNDQVTAVIEVSTYVRGPVYCEIFVKGLGGDMKFMVEGNLIDVVEMMDKTTTIEDVIDGDLDLLMADTPEELMKQLNDDE